MKKVCLLIICLFILSFILTGCDNRPWINMVDTLMQGDYRKANKQYEKIEKNYVHAMNTSEYVYQYIENIVTSFKQDKTSYKTAEKKLNLFSLLEMPLYNLENAKNEVERIQASRTAYNQARELYLANMINEGALLAVKEGRQKVSQKDLMEAVEVVIAGKEKKDRVMNPKEREMVAYHEVGHALVSALQKNSQPVQKITIVPRTMGSLGYTMSMPEEERYLMTESEILAQITTLLGGRAAENLIFGEVSTGASNDIERATKLARGMITQYGMSDKFGPMGLESTQNQYLDGRNVAHHSEQTGALIDKEVSNILVQCQQNAFNLLQDNKDALERISKYLLEKENITGKEFMQLLEETRSK
jgi:hypothetical protein